jgi:hypothetical protein
MRTPILVLALASLAAACASTPSANSSALREGDPAILNRECKLLGTVNGRSMFGGMSDDAKMQAAMNDARDKAVAMGATHVVFTQSDTSGMLNSGHAAARAYRCDKTP